MKTLTVGIAILLVGSAVFSSPQNAIQSLGKTGANLAPTSVHLELDQVQSVPMTEIRDSNDAQSHSASILGIVDESAIQDQQPTDDNRRPDSSNSAFFIDALKTIKAAEPKDAAMERALEAIKNFQDSGQEPQPVEIPPTPDQQTQPSPSDGLEPAFVIEAPPSPACSYVWTDICELDRMIKCGVGPSSADMAGSWTGYNAMDPCRNVCDTRTFCADPCGPCGNPCGPTVIRERYRNCGRILFKRNTRITSEYVMLDANTLLARQTCRSGLCDRSVNYLVYQRNAAVNLEWAPVTSPTMVEPIEVQPGEQPVIESPAPPVDPSKEQDESTETKSESDSDNDENQDSSDDKGTIRRFNARVEDAVGGFESVVIVSSDD